MAITINVTETKSGINPSEVYGQKHGKVFQQIVNGKTRNSFLISTGENERPIDIWWDAEENEYKLSSSSEKELTGFSSLVKYREIEADVSITIEI